MTEDAAVYEPSLTPVVSGIEAGSELLKAAAIVLIGGLLTSTVFTRVFVPAMYTVFDEIEQAFVRLVRRFACRGSSHQSKCHPPRRR